MKFLKIINCFELLERTSKKRDFVKTFEIRISFDKDFISDSYNGIPEKNRLRQNAPWLEEK